MTSTVSSPHPHRNGHWIPLTVHKSIRERSGSHTCPPEGDRRRSATPCLPGESLELTLCSPSPKSSHETLGAPSLLNEPFRFGLPLGFFLGLPPFIFSLASLEKNTGCGGDPKQAEEIEDETTRGFDILLIVEKSYACRFPYHSASGLFFYYCLIRL